MTLGNLEIFLLSDGLFRLDGGAMFGVVPRVLWERMDVPVKNNHIGHKAVQLVGWQSKHGGLADGLASYFEAWKASQA